VFPACSKCGRETIRLDADPLDWPIEERPLIYVAGYFSANPMHGTHYAVKAFDELVEAGWLPLVPHASVILDMISPRTSDFWYKYDLGLLQRCDAMYVCFGALTKESVGVAEEIRYATEHDIPIFYEVVQAKDRYSL
jgi:hypothetical protein